MKKILTCVFISAMSLPALAFTDASMINVHDMQMINQQRFRMEEINDYKEVKEEKARFEKRINSQKPEKLRVENQIIQKEPELVDDAGQIKIKY